MSPKILLIVFAAACDAQPKLEPQQLQEDFRIMRSALEEGHSGIYRYTRKEQLDKVFEDALRRLDQPMTALELYRVAAPAVANIKCGHTSVAPPRDVQQAITTTVPLFPFAVEVLEGRVYIWRDFSTDDGRWAGSELRSVNGVPAAQLLTKMTAATPGDGNVPTSRAWRIGHGGAFNRQLYSIAGIASPFRLALRTPDSKDQTVNATGIAQPALREMSAKRYPNDRKDGAADFRFEDDGAIAVLTVRTFGGSPANSAVPLDRYFPDVFRQIREKGSKTLIIDVRNNGGGADALGKQLFSFLWDKPFQYYDDLIINARTFGFKPYMTTPRDIPEDEVEKRDDGKYHAIKHPNWGTQQPSEPHFAGNVLILINGGSFSTTCEFTSTVHFHKRAKCIGEEAGGGYYGNTSGFGAGVTLPNSKLQVSIPLQTYYLAVSGYDRPDRSVIPDYPVHDTIQDLLSGKDNAMDLALRLARK